MQCVEECLLGQPLLVSRFAIRLQACGFLWDGTDRCVSSLVPYIALELEFLFFILFYSCFFFGVCVRTCGCNIDL